MRWVWVSGTSIKQDLYILYLQSEAVGRSPMSFQYLATWGNNLRSEPSRGEILRGSPCRTYISCISRYHCNEGYSLLRLFGQDIYRLSKYFSHFNFLFLLFILNIIFAIHPKHFWLRQEPKKRESWISVRLSVRLSVYFMHSSFVEAFKQCNWAGKGVGRVWEASRQAGK